MTGPRDPEADARRTDWDPDSTWPSPDQSASHDSDPWGDRAIDGAEPWADWSPRISEPAYDDEPEPPVSDPWAESWRPDTSAEPAVAAPLPDEDDTLPDPWAEPWDTSPEPEGRPSAEAETAAPAWEPPLAATRPAEPPAVAERAEPIRPALDPSERWWLEPTPATEPDWDALSGLMTEPAPVIEQAPAVEPPPTVEAPMPERELVAEPEAVPESVAAAEPEAVAEPVAAAEPEAVPESVAAAEPEAVAEPVAAAEPVAVPESVAAAEPTPVPEPELAPQPELVVEPEAVVEPVAAAEPEAVPEPMAVVEPEAVAAAEPEAVPEPFAAAEPEAVDEPVAAAEPEAVPEPVAEREPQAVAEPVAAAEPEAVAEPVAEAEPEAVAEPVAAAEPGAVAEPVAGAEPQAIAEPTPQPEAQPEPPLEPSRDEAARAASVQGEAPQVLAEAEAEAETAAEEAELDDLPAAARFDEWGLPVRTTPLRPWTEDQWTTPEEAEETRAFPVFQEAPTAGLEAGTGGDAAAVRAEAPPSEAEPAEPSVPEEPERPVKPAEALDGRDLNAYREALGLAPIGQAPAAGIGLAPQEGPIVTRRERGHELPAGFEITEEDAEAEVEARPTLAEQAVPWLIGIVLLLAGMVIVLLALIFAGDGSLAGVLPDASGGVGASPSLVLVAGPSAPEATPSASVTPATTPTPAPTPSATALPEYGPLEMVYLGRSAALEPIYLLRHDFTTDGQPEVLAQDPALDVRRFAWAPDGRVGAALLVDRLVSIEPGAEKRPLGDGISAITFGADARFVYAVRVTQDGTNDIAVILRIDYASAASEEVARVTYARPTRAPEGTVADARYEDEGGAVRLFWMRDGTLRLWVVNTGTWSIDPERGEATDLGDRAPVLWSPDESQRVVVTTSADTSTLVCYRSGGQEVARTQIAGLVSHVRWSPAGDQVAFTRGRGTANGGVLQDLFLWQLRNGEAPMQLTNTGAGFGPEWLGVLQAWVDAP